MVKKKKKKHTVEEIVENKRLYGYAQKRIRTLEAYIKLLCPYKGFGKGYHNSDLKEAIEYMINKIKKEELKIYQSG